MSKQIRTKSRFRPRVNRIELNPEQAVLYCSCHSAGNRWGWVNAGPGGADYWLVPAAGATNSACWFSGIKYYIGGRRANSPTVYAANILESQVVSS
jgi:hypothetical protein